ncbi:hypothetical protein fugu_014283 [Takifugu bimaculatus]|uniref:Uncharacterized protein n=1 Tax=Takifugu bimaculatus TaxID=433685 RepID=A0A4Z2C1N4_9TELE|nr:hypothetical protein fugu_014283 [Takifugu bimaculatus]
MLTFLYVVLQFNLTLQAAGQSTPKVYDKHMLGTGQRNIGGAVLHAAKRGPQPHAQGEDKDALSITCHETPSLERVEQVEQRCRLVPLCPSMPDFSPNAEFLTSACVAGAVEPPGFRLNLLVIVLILLGLPMILLAVLLMARSQRLYKTVFPRIPRPPPDYMKALDKNDRLNEPHPCTPAEEEVITVVLFE